MATVLFDIRLYAHDSKFILVAILALGAKAPRSFALSASYWGCIPCCEVRAEGQRDGCRGNQAARTALPLPGSLQTAYAFRLGRDRFFGGSGPGGVTD
jgi:hypothetical protein